ncbi:MLP-like protein 34 [Bienertia sinuspersici]
MKEYKRITGACHVIPKDSESCISIIANQTHFTTLENSYMCSFLSGKPYVVTLVLDEIDEEKKFVKYRAIEGDLMKEYKRITGACHVIPKDSESCIVKWIFEYDKLHAGIPEPSTLLDS